MGTRVWADWVPGTDITELALPSTMRTNFPDPEDILNFTLTIEPDEGLWCHFFLCGYRAE